MRAPAVIGLSIALAGLVLGGDVVIASDIAARGRPVRLLFIHHSVGGQWLADPGPDSGKNCVYRSHPNGGGLRAALVAAGFEVREASYGSPLGARTDLFDWLPKFEHDIASSLSDVDVVAFKSCFPNSRFTGEGTAPGDPAGPALTLRNAEATMRALLPVLARYPAVRFVYVTAPPLAAPPAGRPAWKRVGDRVRRAWQGTPDPADSARWARAFNDWLKAPGGWLAAGAPRNVSVFDYYDVLTGHGRSDFLIYPTGDGTDSHPSAEGHRRATAEFVPFLERVIRNGR